MEGGFGEYDLGSSSWYVGASSTISNGGIRPTNAPFGNSLSQFVTIKLDEQNSLLWKSPVIPVIEGYDLDGYLFGMIPSSEKLLEDGSPNPAYKFWFG